jgi:hypothetical protein
MIIRDTTTTTTTSSRSVSSTVIVTILPALSASVTLQSTAALNIINPGQQLQITGCFLFQCDLEFFHCWIRSFSIALTPSKSAFLQQPTTTTPFPVYLTNQLQGGLTYSFVLTCSLPFPGSITTSSISINVNSALRPGKFLVNPNEGVEFTDSHSRVSNGRMRIFRYNINSVSWQRLVVMFPWLLYRRFLTSHCSFCSTSFTELYSPCSIFFLFLLLFHFILSFVFFFLFDSFFPFFYMAMRTK